MNRRTFLKSTVIASATPAAAFAPLQEQGGIGALVADHYRLQALAIEATDTEDRIYNSPGRPALPVVDRKEIAFPYRASIGWTQLDSLDTINGYFDSRPRGWLPSPDIEARREGLEVERAKILALFKQRQGDFDEWAKASGYSAALAESGRLWARRSDIETQILDFPCTTLEEVVIKARFINSELKGEIDELAEKIFAQLASIGTGTGEDQA